MGRRKRVLAVTYGGGHVNIMVTVLKLLRQEAQVDIVVLGLTIAGHVLASAGFTCKTYRDYFDPVADAEALRLGAELLEDNFVPGKGISREDSLIYLGMAWRDTIAEYGDAEARRLLRENGKRELLPLATMERIIKAEQPDLLLTGNCPRSERAATLVAARRGLPSINIVDYLATEKRHFLAADRIAVMSEITRENLIRVGHDPNRIVVTGQPAFDSISSDSGRTDRNACMRGLGLDPARRALILATQKKEFYSQEMVRACAAALREFPEVDLVIKPHPGEDERDHRRLLEEEKIRAYFTPQADIRDLINIGDALVTYFSTCGLEAVLMGKPFISLNLSGGPNPIPLADYEVCTEVNSTEGLVRALHDAWENEALRQAQAAAREKYFGCVLDGGGTRRVADLVYEMVGVGGGTGE